MVEAARRCITKCPVLPLTDSNTVLILGSKVYQISPQSQEDRGRH